MSVVSEPGDFSFPSNLAPDEGGGSPTPPSEGATVGPVVFEGMKVVVYSHDVAISPSASKVVESPTSVPF